VKDDFGLARFLTLFICGFLCFLFAMSHGHCLAWFLRWLLLAN